MTRCAWRFIVVALTVLSASLPGHAQKDREGCQDYPLLPRLNGFSIEGCKDEAFSKHDFTTLEGMALNRRVVLVKR
jgi:hypothetical protein